MGAFMVLVAVVLAGCTMPADLNDIHEDLSSHGRTLPADALSAPLSMDDAVQIAIRFNLDARMKTLEAALAAGKADLTIFTLLPQMAANGGLIRRNPPNLSTSQDLSTGTTSTNPSLSEDAFRRTGDLTASWNLMDFGIALMRLDQDDARIQQSFEKRRRAIHLLVQDVRSAYWKAVINEFARKNS